MKRNDIETLTPAIETILIYSGMRKRELYQQWKSIRSKIYLTLEKEEIIKRIETFDLMMRSNLDVEPELITAQKLYDDFIDDMSNYLCDHDVVVGRETRLLASFKTKKTFTPTKEEFEEAKRTLEPHLVHRG